MSKLVGLACVLGLLGFLAKPQSDKFPKYKAVEAYEVRPGILMLPTYSSDGEVCQIVVEREHYFNGTVVLDSTMQRDVVNQIVDELAPVDQRGPLTTNPALVGVSVYTGSSVTSFVDYKNVSVDIARLASSKDDVVALIRWKNVKCK